MRHAPCAAYAPCRHALCHAHHIGGPCATCAITAGAVCRRPHIHAPMHEDVHARMHAWASHPLLYHAPLSLPTCTGRRRADRMHRRPARVYTDRPRAQSYRRRGKGHCRDGRHRTGVPPTRTRTPMDTTYRTPACRMGIGRGSERLTCIPCVAPLTNLNGPSNLRTRLDASERWFCI